MKVLVLLPEVLVGFAAFLCALAALPRRRTSARDLRLLVLALLIAALILEVTLGSQLLRLFNGGLVQDRFALYSKLVLLGALLVAVLSVDTAATREVELAQVLLAGLGAMVAASAADLLTLWSAVALAALATAAAAALARRPGTAMVAGFVAAALAALAFGFALVYGVAGFSRLADIQRVMGFEPLSVPLAISLGLVVLALAAMVLLPWVDGSPAGGAPIPRAVEALPSAFAGAAAVVVALKLVASLAGVQPAWSPYLAALAAIAMLLGGTSALAASTLRPLVASVSLTQLGWVLASGVASYRLGVAAGLFLLGVYLLAACASGPAALGLTAAGASGARLSRLAGSVVVAPMRTLALGLLLLSLAGVPPLGGWFGQFAVATELARSGHAWLLAVGFLGSASAAFATMRLLRVAFLEPLPLDLARAAGPFARPRFGFSDAGPVLAAVLVSAWGLFAYPIYSLATQAGTALWVH